MEMETLGSGNPELKQSENVLYGCLGAFLMSLVGGAATVLLLQLNVIAGLAGMLGVVLGYWGYKKFTKQPYSRKGLWLSIVIAVLVQLAAYYLGVALLNYREVDGMLPFGTVLKLMPQWLREEEEFRGAVLGDLVKLLLFMAIASAGIVVSTSKQIKAQQAQEAARGSLLYRDNDCDADR